MQRVMSCGRKYGRQTRANDRGPDGRQRRLITCVICVTYGLDPADITWRSVDSDQYRTARDAPARHLAPSLKTTKVMGLRARHFSKQSLANQNQLGDSK